MSAGAVGCKPKQIKISDKRSSYGSRTWTASCQGKDYSCSQVATGESSSQVSCSPMASEASDWSSGGGSSPVYSRNPTGGSAERAYDEQRELHIVRGKFNLTPGFELKMVGVPQLKLGAIAVLLSVNTKTTKFADCSALEILVNEQPFSSQENSAQKKDPQLTIESRFDFQTFKPLAQDFATFGLRACGRAFKLNGAQVGELQKFLIIYAQVAAQVENGELPSKEGQELETSPASSRDGV